MYLHTTLLARARLDRAVSGGLHCVRSWSLVHLFIMLTCDCNEHLPPIPQSIQWKVWSNLFLKHKEETCLKFSSKNIISIVIKDSIVVYVCYYNVQSHFGHAGKRECLHGFLRTRVSQVTTLSKKVSAKGHSNKQKIFKKAYRR